MYQGRYQSKAPARKRPARRRKLNKYFLVTLSLVLLLGVAGGATLAYIIAEGGTVANSFTPGEVKCSVNDQYEITNDGNVDAYIRAAVVVNWENAAGEINGIAPKEGTDYTLTLGAGWQKIGDYYYYQKVVDFEGALEKTTPVVSVAQNTTAPDGFRMVVEVLAEAIQADGTNAAGETPIEDAWGVTAPAENG